MNILNSNFVTKLFKLNEKKSNVNNELYSGLMLFITIFFVINFVSSILKDSFSVGESILIFPALFFVVGISTGLLTIISGFITNLPFAIVPSIFFSLLIALTGNIFLGYSLKYILISAFIASVAYVFTSFVFKKDKLLDLIPDFLKNSFTLIFGLLLIIFGLLYSNIITKTQFPEPATTLGTATRTVFFNLPATIGNILSPIPLLTILGLCLFTFLYLKKKNRNAFLITFITLILVGLFLPSLWNKFAYSTKLTSFSRLLLRKEGLQILFSNITLPNLQLNIPAFVQFGKILKASYSLLFLIFTFYFSLFYFNLHNIFSLLNLNLGVDEKENNISRNYNKLTKFSSISSLFGILTNTTIYTYAYESVFSFFNNGKTGLTAIFCGLLVLIYTFIAPLRYFISTPATAFAVICIGLFVLEKAIKNISLKNIDEFLPAVLMVIISCITFNPVEGLLIGFSTYSLISIIQINIRKRCKIKLVYVFFINSDNYLFYY